MKKLKIDIFDCTIYIYKKEERARFAKDYQTGVETASFAEVRGNGVWIGDHTNRVGMCYHEATHLADWIMEERLEMTQGSLSSNTELRAYIIEYVGNEIVDYVI